MITGMRWALPLTLAVAFSHPAVAVEAELALAPAADENPGFAAEFEAGPPDLADPDLDFEGYPRAAAPNREPSAKVLPVDDNLYRPLKPEMLVALLRDEDYETLDAELTALQSAFEAGRLPEAEVEMAFAAFENSDPVFEQRFDDWVAAMPRSFAAEGARGLYYWRLGWRERGGRYPGDTPPERIARMRDHHEKALDSLQRARALNPRFSLAYALLISLAATTGDRFLRQDALHVGLRAVPRSALIRFHYLKSLQPWWGGSLDDIRTFLAETREAFPDDPELDFLQGYLDFATAETWRQQDKRTGPTQYYDRAVRHGAYWWYLYRRGRYHAWMGHEEEAAKDFSAALDLRPRSVEVLDARASLLRSQGKRELALADWTAALKVDPYDPGVLRHRGDLLMSEGRFAEAQEDFENALVRGDLEHRSHAANGRFLLERGRDLAAAADSFRLASRLYPRRASYWYGYARSLYLLHDCEMVPALDRFLQICDLEGPCDSTEVDWANGAIEYLVVSGECPRS